MTTLKIEFAGTRHKDEGEKKLLAELEWNWKRTAVRLAKYVARTRLVLIWR